MKQPSFSQALHFLQKGDALSARAVLQQWPVADAHHAFLLGACAHALNEIPEAIARFTDALMRNPGHAQAAAALGSLLAGLGRKSQAESVFRKALRHADDAQLRFNLAVILEDDGRTDEALASYNHILADNPAHYAARHNRAGLYTKLQRLQDAVADYRYLVKRHPEALLSWHNLAELELANGHYEESIRLLKHVLEQSPDNGKAWLSYALALAANGEIPESDSAFRQLKIIDGERWQEAFQRIHNQPVSGDIDSRLVFLVRARDHLAICHWRYWLSTIKEYESLLAKPSLADMMTLSFVTLFIPFDANQQRRLMQMIGQQIETSVKPFTYPPKKELPQKIRIAYLAPNWGNHVTAYQAREIVTSHDHDFDVHVVSLRKQDDSDNIKYLKECTNIAFHDLGDLTDEEAARYLRTLDLDIAVDMAVYSNENRPAVMAYRPAPVQIARQGAPYTSGASWIDYVVSDDYVRPSDNWCTEAEILMPSCYYAFASKAAANSPLTRKEAGLPEGKFVFSSLSNPLKINPPLFNVWMEILPKAPDSVLWLLADDAAGIANLRREAEWAGIDPERLIFAGRVRPDKHVARMGAADLMLDTWPCNGHTTMAENLWVGTPAISLKGNTFAGRVGGSMLRAVGLKELIAESESAYIDLAVALYHDRNRLVAYRNHLVEAGLNADLFYPQRQVKHFEKAFREVVRRYRKGEPIKTIRLADY